jgi:hypothetical protein
MRLEKAQSNRRSQERMLDLKKSCVEVLLNTIRIQCFLLKNLVKKNPSWTSHFLAVHCEWAMYFLTKPKLAFLTSQYNNQMIF